MDFTVAIPIVLVAVLVGFGVVSPVYAGPRRRLQTGALVTRTDAPTR